jgi:predicted RNA-binding protein with PIN domain
MWRSGRARAHARALGALQPSRDWGIFGRGALEALGVSALFVLLGFAWVALVERAPVDPAGYAGDPVPELIQQQRRWLVDGFNVVQHALLGGRDRECWWTAARRAELVARSANFDDPDAEIWLVFDGAKPVDARGDAPRPHLVFAPSADAWLLAQVRSAGDPAQIAVVTADRRLAARVRHRGALVVAPIDFLKRCPG